MLFSVNVHSRFFLKAPLGKRIGLVLMLAGLSSCQGVSPENTTSSPSESEVSISTNAVSYTAEPSAESPSNPNSFASAVASESSIAEPVESIHVASDPPSNTAITYDYLAPKKQLTATVNGETFVLIDLINATPDHLFLDVAFREGNPAAQFLSQYSQGLASIEHVGDFDGDGFDDAVVGFSNGGNCCAPGYAVISVLNDGSFRLSPLLEWAWNPPQPTTFNGQQAFETRTDNQLYVHAYENGQVVLLDERIIQERQAIAQLRASEVISGESPPRLAFDINDDGVMETLSCEVWDRWQSLLCQIEHPDGTVLHDLHMGCDRYGILSTVTNGMHDIVCNEQTIARWNGTEYVWD